MRVLRKRDYRSIYAMKQRTAGRYIVIDSVFKGPEHSTRMGVVVSSRFGKAHERNRFKRMVRESFRLAYPDLPKGWDFAIRPRTAAHGSALKEIQDELLMLSERIASNANQEVYC